jgi:glucan 1,3-beta-glucosidase
VNIGGWLVTEPFITPALYEKYSHLTYENGSFQIIDEWKLSAQMKADGSIGDLEQHYATFIVSCY